MEDTFQIGVHSHQPHSTGIISATLIGIQVVVHIKLLSTPQLDEESNNTSYIVVHITLGSSHDHLLFVCGYDRQPVILKKFVNMLLDHVWPRSRSFNGQKANLQLESTGTRHLEVDQQITLETNDNDILYEGKGKSKDFITDKDSSNLSLEMRLASLNPQQVLPSVAICPVLPHANELHGNTPESVLDIQIDDANHSRRPARALVDTGCLVGNWISYEKVYQLGLAHQINPAGGAQAQTADGTRIQCDGSILLDWIVYDGGKTWHTTQFYVGQTAFDVILGLDFIQSNNVVRFNKNVLLPILPFNDPTPKELEEIERIKQQIQIERAQAEARRLQRAAERAAAAAERRCAK